MNVAHAMSHSKKHGKTKQHDDDDAPTTHASHTSPFLHAATRKDYDNFNMEYTSHQFDDALTACRRELAKLLVGRPSPSKHSIHPPAQACWTTSW